jgi:hypothetical protein
MAGLDAVLRRLAGDADFRSQVAIDPRTALAGYDLTTEELGALAEHVDAKRGEGSGFAALFESD